MVATTAESDAISSLVAAAEIVGGEAFVHPRPGPRQAHALSRLGVILGGPFDLGGEGGGGGWVLLDGPTLRLGDDILVPDLAGWRRSRLPQLPDGDVFTSAPDWVCEALTPATEAFDRSRKLPIYAREAVTHVWMVDPLARVLEVLVRDDRAWHLSDRHEGEAFVYAAPFEALALDLGLLWH